MSTQDIGDSLIGRHIAITLKTDLDGDVIYYRQIVALTTGRRGSNTVDIHIVLNMSLDQRDPDDRFLNAWRTPENGKYDGYFTNGKLDEGARKVWFRVL